VRRQLEGMTNISILNVGIATGATSIMLEEFGSVTNLEYDKDCCEFVRKELNMEVTQASLTDLPYKDNTFDLICAFDVIEHIEDDAAAVSEINRTLKTSGQFMITVPAFMMLWSHHDVVNHHYRRYTAGSLKDVLSGRLNIQYLSYFNTLLFPPIAAFRLGSRIFNKKESNTSTGSDFEIMKSDGIINDVFYNIFLMERAAIQRLVSLPFGVSLICTGTKRL